MTKNGNRRKNRGKIKKIDQEIKELGIKLRKQKKKNQKLWNFIKEGNNGIAPIQCKDYYFILPYNHGYGRIKTII